MMNKTNLTMNHATVHDPADNTLPVLAQLEGDAHGLVCVALKLNEPDPRDVLDLRHAITVRSALQPAPDPAVVEERGETRCNRTRGRRGDPDSILSVNFVCYNIVALKN